MLAQASGLVTEIVSTDLSIIAIDRLEHTAEVAVAQVGCARVTIVTHHVLWLTDVIGAGVYRTGIVIFTFIVTARRTWDDTRYNRRIRAADVHITEVLCTGHFIIANRSHVDTRKYAS